MCTNRLLERKDCCSQRVVLEVEMAREMQQRDRTAVAAVAVEPLRQIYLYSYRKLQRSDVSVTDAGCSDRRQEEDWWCEN